jgi:hypothetical protein
VSFVILIERSESKDLAFYAGTDGLYQGIVPKRV